VIQNVVGLMQLSGNVNCFLMLFLSMPPNVRDAGDEIIASDANMHCDVKSDIPTSTPSTIIKNGKVPIY
jgi:hypothetical protein